MAMNIPRGAVVANVYSLVPYTLRSSSFMATHTARTAAVSWSSILPSASIAIPSITLNIPGVISDIWEGILRAVPKKKTSHMKKRHRQLAGKALKDFESLVQCPACRRPKKAHMLCPYCVADIGSRYVGQARKKRATTAIEEPSQHELVNQEGRTERREMRSTATKAQADLGIEETSDHKRQAEIYKEQAALAVEQQLLNDQARLPARKRGGWRNDLKYL